MPIITVSRRSHSGGRLLAEALSARLGWPALSQEDVSSAAAVAYGMTEKELFRGLYLPANFFERFTHQKDRYLLATQATITRLLPDGNGIYHGLAGQFLFQDACNAFRVRLVAPMEYRIDTAVKALGISRAEAVKVLHDNDDHRARWSRQIFGVDITDSTLYDLVVNLEHVSIDAATEMITEIMSRPEHQPTPTCLQEYRDFALERRVRAELQFNSPFYRGGLEIKASAGEVFLSGGKSFESQRDAMVAYVAKIAGVERVSTERGTVDRAEVTDVALTSSDASAADVMLRPDRYPHCRLDCTIREAIVALSASAVRLEDGHITVPRYVLVLDDDDRLVGVVSRRDLLKGLVPHLLEDRESEAHIREFVPFLQKTAGEARIRWTSFFSKAAIDAAQQPVKLVMVPIRGTVQSTDTLSTVISTMLHYGIDLVPVLDGEKVAGVVLMTNIFDFVAQFVMENRPGPAMADGGSGDDG